MLRIGSHPLVNASAPRAKSDADGLREGQPLRKGQVISRTEIEEHIYDELVSPMSNVVDTAVCALRRAIAVSDDSVPLIHTRRGMGYVIEEPPR